MQSQHQGLDARRLFFIANLSIFMIGLGFAVRANIASHIDADLFQALDPIASASMVGEVLGATFLGFAFTLLFGSAIVDKIGIRHMMGLAAVGYILGSLLVVAASVMAVSSSTYTMVYTGLLLTGLGWGAVEAASNPMVAALYPEEKTKRLNILHAWWPAGIVVGGLSGIGLAALDLSWQLNLLILLLPALLMAAMVYNTEFPVTERVAAGISYGDMFKELLKSPSFFIWFGCMFLTAAAELAPGQWVDISLSNVVGMQGILLLVYVSALMFVMRQFFAGFFARVFGTVGLLWFSALAAAAGLYALSLANSPVSALLAATLWGIGVCYMWPTMLANVSERYPRGGALMMGMMGFAGGMAIQFVLPQMGAIFDRAKLEAAGSPEQLQAMAVAGGAAYEEVLRYASVESFQSVALVPLLLLPIFAGLWLYDKKTGYRSRAINEH